MNPRAVAFGAMEIDLRKVVFTPDLRASIPADLARRYRVIPIKSSLSTLLLALSDPSDLNAIDSLRNSLRRDLELCVAEAEQIDEFVRRFYGEEP
jgi:type IV pilus assembly protein PilB